MSSFRFIYDKLTKRFGAFAILAPSEESLKNMIADQLIVLSVHLTEKFGRTPIFIVGNNAINTFIDGDLDDILFDNISLLEELNMSEDDIAFVQSLTVRTLFEDTTQKDRLKELITKAFNEYQTDESYDLFESQVRSFPCIDVYEDEDDDESEEDEEEQEELTPLLIHQMYWNLPEEELILMATNECSDREKTEEIILDMLEVDESLLRTNSEEYSNILKATKQEWWEEFSERIDDEYSVEDVLEYYKNVSRRRYYDYHISRFLNDVMVSDKILFDIQPNYTCKIDEECVSSFIISELGFEQLYQTIKGILSTKNEDETNQK